LFIVKFKEKLIKFHDSRSLFLFFESFYVFGLTLLKVLKHPELKISMLREKDNEILLNF